MTITKLAEWEMCVVDPINSFWALGERLVKFTIVFIYHMTLFKCLIFGFLKCLLAKYLVARESMQASVKKWFRSACMHTYQNSYGCC